ncbi:hypothetical protein, partial [Pseudoxanthomonas mexicana]|uniref:hypothetical protein n=1 Tax=Pseudoxanthomonas mexicana TaxID=128785 RepID=UPI001E62C9B4
GVLVGSASAIIGLCILHGSGVDRLLMAPASLFFFALVVLASVASCVRRAVVGEVRGLRMGGAVGFGFMHSRPLAAAG